MSCSSALVIGEALIDLVSAADGTVSAFVGGSPANVAVGLARLGVRVQFATALAEDRHGSRIVHHLRTAGVEIDPGSFSLARTSTASARLSDDRDATYTFDIEWPTVMSIDVSNVAVAHAGSLAIFLDPGAEATAVALGRARGAGSIVSVDPNIRRALLPDHGAALHRFERVARHCHLVKLSAEDATWLYPAATLDDVSHRLLTLGPDLVVITRGADGSTLATLDAIVHRPAPRVIVADTVGAGDAFQSALLAWVLDHRTQTLRNLKDVDLAELGDFAARAAAWTVQQRGAEPPTREQIGARPRPASQSPRGAHRD